MANSVTGANILDNAFIETIYCDPRDWHATESVRKIRLTGVAKLKPSFVEIGFLDNSKIMRHRLPDGGLGNYCIFEGNHRWMLNLIERLIAAPLRGSI